MKLSKLKFTIFLFIILYSIAIVCMFFGVQKYITHKDKKLYTEIQLGLNKIFPDFKTKIVDIVYSGGTTDDYKDLELSQKKYYERQFTVQLELNPSPFKENKIYKDYVKIYKKPHDGFASWKLVILENSFNPNYSFIERKIYPYAVGYTAQGAECNISLESAINKALDFYKTNTKSELYEHFKENSYIKTINKVNALQNEYYHICEVHDGTEYYGGTSIDNYSKDIKYGSIKNNFYEVFIAQEESKKYAIEKYIYKPDELEKRSLWKQWSIILTIIFLTTIIPLCYIYIKRVKEKNENLYRKLIRLCNPSNFIKHKDYNKEIVDKANSIYKRLIDTTPEDKNTLNEIQIAATTELGIDLINKDKVDELKKKVNLKKFIKHYNAEKLALANELYATISNENITYNDIIYVENKLKELYTS